MTSHNKSPITLYSYVSSPYAAKVHCYLLYKKLPFNVFYVTPLNPVKELPFGHQIPVLKMGDQIQTESSNIGLWLDNTFPDTLPLSPKDKQLKQDVMEMDDWVSSVLIPSIFYSIYPQINTSCFHTISNAMRLGFCVGKTTTNGLPYGIRLLWPLFIRYAGFIRHMITPMAREGSPEHIRAHALSYLEEKLQQNKFLANTPQPSLADLSAWPQIVMPYKLGLKGFDDFKDYPAILRWINEIDPFLCGSNQSPTLIPQLLENTSLSFQS